MEHARTRAAKRAPAGRDGNPRQPKARRLSGVPQPAPHPAGVDPDDRGAVGGTPSAAASGEGDEAKDQPPEVVLPQPANGVEIPQHTVSRVGGVVRSWFDLDEGDDAVGFGVGDPCSHGEPAASSLPLVRLRVLRP